MGRMMADPGFPQKMLFEVAFTGIGSLGYELDQRRENFFKVGPVTSLHPRSATRLDLWLLASQLNPTITRHFLFQFLILCCRFASSPRNAVRVYA